MNRHFSLFYSHLDLAHQYWERILRLGDFAIDATCGNGHDTLKLAQILLQKGSGGGVVGIDIQEEAIARTKALLQAHLQEGGLSRIHLFAQSHVCFPPLELPIRLVAYNLGYLPKGDKRLTTLTESTLESIRNALGLIVAGGAISITCYPGHEEGAREEKAILEEVSCLPPAVWNVCHHRFANRQDSPSLVLIQKS
jgi:hypothetical protein